MEFPVLLIDHHHHHHNHHHHRTHRPTNTTTTTTQPSFRRRVQDLEAMGRITGVFDDRGKFVYVERGEVEKVLVLCAACVHAGSCVCDCVKASGAAVHASQCTCIHHSRIHDKRSLPSSNGGGGWAWRSWRGRAISWWIWRGRQKRRRPGGGGRRRRRRQRQQRR